MREYEGKIRNVLSYMPYAEINVHICKDRTADP